jgi:hypothetical protein
MTAPQPGLSWRSFTTSFVLASLAAAAFLYASVYALDPYGTRTAPGRAPAPIMDLNQRFMYPQIARSGRFDAAVFGTSTVRLLDPEFLDRIFGARFANLGLNAGTPWEQMQLAGLFLRAVPQPKALIFGLDSTWCEADADEKRTTVRTFPPWLYDDDGLNDLPEMFNLTTLEIAGRLILHRLGLMRERIRDDGYERFVPDDALYDLARARTHLRPQVATPAAPVALTAEERAALRFPALAWLDESLSRVPKATAVTLTTTPVHVALLAPAGSRAAAIEAECKARIGAIAARHGAAFVDFRFPSAVTREDSNYWDPLHYRVGIAQRMITALAAARVDGRDAPDGFYRVVTPAGS